jgi:hypothetical protein
MTEIPQPTEAFTSHSMSPPSTDPSILSPKSITSPIFPGPGQIPLRRHSVQPSVKSDFAAALKTTIATELKEVPEIPTSTTTEKVDRQASWGEKVSGEPIVKDPDGMRVLLVEDNEINLKLLVAYMRKLKLNHATACNGLEAVNAYKDAHEEKKHFDVIFMGKSSILSQGLGIVIGVVLML